MMLEPGRVLSVVRAFVKRTRGDSAIDVDTPLLQEGLIDSFGLVELSAEIARAVGVDLGPGALLPEDFESVAVLEARLQELLS